MWLAHRMCGLVEFGKEAICLFRANISPEVKFTAGQPAKSLWLTGIPPHDFVTVYAGSVNQEKEDREGATTGCDLTLGLTQ